MALLCFFLFFKQKTAYEMRISDWSSDVCSSDLHAMLRVTKLTDYATVVLTVLASEPDVVASAAGLAERAGLEAPTVAKLLKPLAQAGLVEAFRGANGGYRLARPAAGISLFELVEAMEGPLGLTECSVHVGRCGIEDH